MNLFRSKGPDIEEVSRENRTKKNIISELSTALKKIQTTHCRLDEPVYSSDCSNQLCTVFEAILLHGLKEAQKLRNCDPQILPTVQCSFWVIVKRFSHQDVITQLKRFANIKTEVGISRAWIKLAINDGLMESYLSALLSEPDFLRGHYVKTALLRDPESPEIVMKLIQLLPNYHFQLVCNLQSLNAWSASAVALAGYLPEYLSRADAVLTAAVSGSDTLSASVARSRSETLVMDDVPDIYPSARIIATGPRTPGSQVIQPKLEPVHTRLESNDRTIQARAVTSPDSVDAECNAQSAVNPHSIMGSDDTKVHVTGGVNSLSQSTTFSQPMHFSVASIEKKLAQLQRAPYVLEDVIGKPVQIFQQDALHEQEVVRRCPSPPAAPLPHASSSPVNLGHYGIKGEVSLTPGSLSGAAACIVGSTGFTGSPHSQHSISSDLCVESSRSGKSHSITSDVESDTMTEPEELLDSNKKNQSADGLTFLDHCDRPMSSAQAIFQRRTSGASAFSRGNSLASLTGWGSDREAAKSLPAHPSSIEHVQSFADLVSEYSVTEESFSVSVTNYTQVLAQHERIPEEASGDFTDSAAPQQLNEAMKDDFEVIGEVDQDSNADILKHYGEICNEDGLAAQNFQCYTCARAIGIIYGAPKVCAYTRKYYCAECHTGEEALVPSKIICNWDFSKYKVSRSSKDFLISAESMPLLNVKFLNLRLYDHVPELSKCQTLRTQLYYLNKYLSVCTPSIAEELKGKFWPKEYLYEEIHTYSVQDLILVNTGDSLSTLMKKGVKFAEKHIESCPSCQYRGFRCEICNDPTVIYPFDLIHTTRCDKCNTVFHKSCLLRDCPKCHRISEREKFIGTLDVDSSSFAF